jgi:hypothetical protein
VRARIRLSRRLIDESRGREINRGPPFPPNAANPAADATRPRLQPKHMLGAGVPTRQVDLPDIGRGAHVEGFDLILANHAPLVEMIDLLLLDLAEESDLGGRNGTA